MKWQLSVKIITLHSFPLTNDVIIRCFFGKISIRGFPWQISEKPYELKYAEVVIHIWITTLVRSTPF